MEGQEELLVTNDQASQMIMIKGRRTKRQRPQSPNGVVTVAVTSSSSSACGAGTIGGGDHDYNYCGNSFTSPTTSGEIYESTEEEEDMANCLILLAQGDHVNPKQTIEERLAQNTNMGKAGFFVYECKTCNRTFPSFQALGGHRASHKKPKSMSSTEEMIKKSPPAVAPPTHHFITATTFEEFEDQSKQLIKYKSSPPPAIPIQVGNKPKIHECSICGSEFTSGQALGGHMRRHRTASAATNSNTTSGSATATHVAVNNSSNNMIGTSTKLQRNVLPLDLNLPAPEDHDHHHHHHHRESKFQFVPTQQATLVFNAPALVDCHY
ncbi:zinc finger protein ZAT5 [Pyrus x bretschneideri]|uniref:zinc finger protein ZAT5 n=1 Tax=Pyrus x bretschneideri TaxID=225117 RepID=UPI00202EF313|nr:zinc finger protein ZAT5 [Pyrus x bretschneideri]